jgi:hypothetical protein
MRALLILNRVDACGIGIIVNLHTTSLRKRVLSLLSQNRQKEAFDLIIREAMVEAYVPKGTEPQIKPELTLVEESTPETYSS